MSLRRWNSVIDSGEVRSLGDEIEATNLMTLRPLTRSSPSIAKPPRMAELDDENSDSSMSSEDVLHLTPTKNKARQKKFLRHFQKNELVLEYYSCAFVAEILLQGYLYITKHYVGFYSNVFGRVTKILIHVRDIQRITKNNTALIFPNAIRVYTNTEKYAFASFISRDAACEVIDKVISARRTGVVGSTGRHPRPQMRLESTPETDTRDEASDLCHDNAADVNEEDENGFPEVTGDSASSSQAPISHTTLPAVNTKRGRWKLIYFFVFVIILLIASAVNLYLRIDALLEDSATSSNWFDVIEAEARAVFSQVDDQAIIAESILKKINENLERIHQVTAALEQLNLNQVFNTKAR